MATTGRGSWSIPASREACRASSDAAELLYGPDATPDAIILTHGHFDHVGSVRELVSAGACRCTRTSSRCRTSPADLLPAAGSGRRRRRDGHDVALLPEEAHQPRSSVLPLPADGALPVIGGWRWIHTPGHAPGHVSLFRDYDRALVAGDAFVTTKQESLSAVLTQRPEVHGPPAYFTMDWRAAEESVESSRSCIRASS